jgi:hypothetical protein
MWYLYMDIQPPPPQIPWYSNGYFKMLVIGIVCLFIYIRVRPYIYHVLDVIETIRQMINMLLSFTENVTKKAVDETSVGAKLVVNKLSKPLPEPDESVNQSKNGYCFVGEWKGVRSCVRVDKTPCATQLYSTEQQCVNPQLR